MTRPFSQRIVFIPLAGFISLAGCGGGSSSPSQTLVPGLPVTLPSASSPTPSSPVVTPGSSVPASTTYSNCYGHASSVQVGANDPFSVAAWHLANTGPSQTVSAADNSDAVAGIDAGVSGVQAGGLGCTGKGVTIAVVDSGLELMHEDLRDNIIPNGSWDFVSENADPSPGRSQVALDHGTGVAGVAAATGWNGRGSRGLAPFASLAGFNLLAGEAGTDNQTALAFGAAGDSRMSETQAFGQRAAKVDIFNFSAGADFAAPMDSDVPAVRVEAAKAGTRKLRSGKGAIYLQAAGNEFEGMSDGQLPDGTTVNVVCSDELSTDQDSLGVFSAVYPSCGNANQSPDINPYFYQVAAIAASGRASSYSSASVANWVSGFGGEYGTEKPAIITTDNSGCLSGNNNTVNRTSLLEQLGQQVTRLVADLLGHSSIDPYCNYTGRMNGSSAATPTVAGVVALMLEANPDLTWRDVGYILARTARKIDADIAQNTREVTFTPLNSSKAWQLDVPWTKNAAGFNFQSRYGFGLVDAGAAVKMAATFQPLAGRRLTTLEATAVTPAYAEEDGITVGTAQASFTDPIAVTGPLQVDLQLVNATGADLNPGQLQFELINTTTGLKSVLLPAFTSWYAGGKQFPLVTGASKNFRFMTNTFYGEKLGSYQVRVIDLSGTARPAMPVQIQQARLTSWSL